MNRDELLKKLNQLRSVAELKLSDASKALNDDRFEDATKFQTESDELVVKANAIKSQIEKLDQVGGLSVNETQKSTEVTRLPFDTSDAPAETNKSASEDLNKSVYVLKYGNMGDAVKGVVTDMYGGNYLEKRANQNRAFSKYLRYGNERLSAKEHDSLQELIYTPDIVEQEVKAGYSVKEINSNKIDQQEASLELGGVLTPVDYHADLIKRLMGMTFVRGRARVVTTARDSVEWPRLEGGNSLYTSAARVTWVGQEIPSSATAAQTNVTFSSVKVPVHTVMARVDLSRNLLEDAALNVPALIAELLSESMAVDEDAQFLTGTGGATPEGVLGARATGNDASPVTGVGVTNSGAAAALTADGLIDLVYSLDAQYLADAIMVGRKATFRDIRKLKSGVGDYLWQSGLERGAPPQVLGYDYYMNENMPAIGANAHSILFGSWSRGYLIVDRIGMTLERVTDVTTTGQNKVAMFARRRLGGQTVAPWSFVALKVAA